MADPQNIEAVKIQAKLLNMTEIYSFVVLANYYHWFFKGFVVIDLSMTCLAHKKVSFEWDDKCKEIFQKLKTMQTLALMLTLLVKGKDFIVFCNASCLGFDVVLMQDRYVVGYDLRQLNPFEKNYPYTT